MKQKIIDACIDEYNINGLKFTLDDVSSRIKISKKTIYKYYDSKQNILEDIIHAVFGSVHNNQIMIHKDDSLNLRDKLINVLNCSTSLVNKIKLNNLEAFLKVYPDLYYLIMEKYEMNWTIATDLITQGLKQGIFKKEYSVQLIKGILVESMKSLHKNNVLVLSNINYRIGMEQVINIIIKGVTL